MHFAAQDPLFLFDENGGNAGKHQRQQPIAEQHHEGGENARCGCGRRHVAITDCRAAFEREPDTLGVCMHARFEPVEPRSCRTRPAAAALQAAATGARARRNCAATPRYAPPRAPQTGCAAPIRPTTTAIPPTPHWRGPGRNQNVVAIAREKPLRFAAQMQRGPGPSRIRRTCRHTAHAPPDEVRAVGQFEIERGNGEQAEGKQRPLHPPPGAHRAYVVMRVDTTQAGYAKTILHLANASEVTTLNRDANPVRRPFMTSPLR